MPRPFFRLLVAFGPVLLSGCGSLFSLLPPGIPDGPQLETYAKTGFAPPYRIGDTPRDTLVIGVAYVDQRCNEFFDAVEQMARRTELARTGLASATTQAAIIMTAAETSTLAVANVAGALEVTRALLNEYRVQFTFVPHSSELRSLVIQAMTAQRRGARSQCWSGTRASPTSMRSRPSKKYAENCTWAPSASTGTTRRQGRAGRRAGRFPARPQACREQVPSPWRGSHPRRPTF